MAKKKTTKTAKAKAKAKKGAQTEKVAAAHALNPSDNSTEAKRERKRALIDTRREARANVPEV